MTLIELLREHQTGIIDRWIEGTLSSYAEDGAVFFRKEKDPFHNPVGHALRSGSQAIFENLLEGIQPDVVCDHLEKIIKIRAIQDFSPSQAIGFVFMLKGAIRRELGNQLLDADYSKALAKMDANIDQLALFSFDIYVKCREQIYELRINEVKRSVSAIMDRFNEGAITEPRTMTDEKNISHQGGNR
jgi:hypothetical protein